MRVLEHLSEGGDVLFSHSLAAPDLHGLTNPLVDLPRPRLLCCNLIGQLCQRAVGESGEDLQAATQEEEEKVTKVSPKTSKCVRVFHRPYEVHSQDISERQLGAPRRHLVVTRAPCSPWRRLLPRRRADQVRVDVVFL